MTPIPTQHADHDPLVIAAFAAGDAQGAELDDALALVAACDECASLHHDLRAIATALPDLAAPVRTRDFRISTEQAASLRPAGWRRFLAPLAGPRFAFAGPLGTGLATLGIAGLLVASAAGLPLGGAAAAPAAPAATDAGGEASGPFVSNTTPSVAPAAQAPSLTPAPTAGDRLSAVSAGGESTPEGSGDMGVMGGLPAASGPGSGQSTTGTDGGMAQAVGSGVPAPSDEPKAMAPADAPAAPATTPVLALAAVLLLGGLILGGLRLAARRVA